MKKVKKLLFMLLLLIPFFVGIAGVKADECGKYIPDKVSDNNNVVFKIEVDEENTKSTKVETTDIIIGKSEMGTVHDIVSSTSNVKACVATIKTSSQANSDSNSDSDSDSDSDPSSMGNLMPKKNLTCSDDVKDVVRQIWRYLIVFSPILVLVMGTIDFVKAVGSNDSDAIKKNSVNFIKRVIALCVLMYLPLLIRIIFTWFGLEDSLCF